MSLTSKLHYAFIKNNPNSILLNFTLTKKIIEKHSLLRGSVIVEFALILPILTIICGFFVTYTPVMVEKAVMITAARSAARAAAQLPEKPLDDSTYTPTGEVTGATRTSVAINVAKQILQTAKYKPDNYKYNVRIVPITEKSSGIQITISRTDSIKLFGFTAPFSSCIESVFRLEEQPLPVEYIQDASCNPH